MCVWGRLSCWLDKGENLDGGSRTRQADTLPTSPSCGRSERRLRATQSLPHAPYYNNVGEAEWGVPWTGRADTLCQGVRPVLQVSDDEGAAAIGGGNDPYPALGTVGHELQPLGRMSQDVCAAYLGVARVGHGESGRKRFHQEGIGAVNRLRKDAETLGGQVVLGNAVVMVKPGLCPPTDVKGSLHVAVCPVHDVTQGIPVAHLFEGNLFAREPP